MGRLDDLARRHLVPQPDRLPGKRRHDTVFDIGATPDIYRNPSTGAWSGWGDVSGSFSFAGVTAYTEDTSGNFHLLGVTTGGALKANKIDGGSSTWLGWTTVGSGLAGS